MVPSWVTCAIIVCLLGPPQYPPACPHIEEATMAIALTLQRYLEGHDVRYDVLVHQRTMTARQTARTCEIPADHLAKAVLMRDGQGYVVAVLPASCQLHKAQLWRLLHRPVELASEDDPDRLFGDCARGAIPALSQAYGVE